MHWTVFNISPDAREFLEGEAPQGSLEGENSFGDVGYGGPCPPKGERRTATCSSSTRSTPTPT